MGELLPFRNVRGPSIESPCEICGKKIVPTQGYASIDAIGNVEGYVCFDCFDDLMAEETSNGFYPPRTTA